MRQRYEKNGPKQIFRSVFYKFGFKVSYLGIRKSFPSAKVTHSEPSGAGTMKFAAELQHLTHHSGVPSSRTAATLPERSAR